MKRLGITEKLQKCVCRYLSKYDRTYARSSTSIIKGREDETKYNFAIFTLFHLCSTSTCTCHVQGVPKSLLRSKYQRLRSLSTNYIFLIFWIFNLFIICGQHLVCALTSLFLQYISTLYCVYHAIGITKYEYLRKGSPSL